MTIRELNGQSVHCAEVFVPGPKGSAPREGLLGLMGFDLSALGRRGQSVAIAQLFGLVLPSTIMARHIFRGLKRPLFTDGNLHADKEKLIYTRKPAYDCLWQGSPFDGDISRVEPPAGGVFAVYVSPNDRHQATYPEIDGWINYWTWIEEDQALPEAPVDWVGRYVTKEWTRGTP